MDDENLRSLKKQTEAIQEELDTLTSSVSRLVRVLEQNDHITERTQRSEEAERDRRHEELIKELRELRDITESIGAAHRDLPEALLRYVERRIYDLRTARWEALQAGVNDEPAPLLPVPRQREPTGSFRTAEPAAEDLSLTPGQQRGLIRLGGWIAGKWHWFAAAVGASGLVKWLHDLFATRPGAH